MAGCLLAACSSSTTSTDGGALGDDEFDGGILPPGVDAKLDAAVLPPGVDAKLDAAVLPPGVDAKLDAPPTTGKLDAPTNTGKQDAAPVVDTAPIPIGPTQGLTIPTGHPRLWWNAARIATGKTWFAKNPYTPRFESEDYIGWAAHYVLTGDTKSCRAAIDWAVKLTLPPLNGGTSDQARWNGENSIVIYDWCFNVMTDAERKNILDKWGDLTTKLSTFSKGQEANNYFWGYIRNDIEYGMVAAGEHAQASSWLANGLKTRWAELFLPYALADGQGGIPAEGTQYGRYMLGYAVMPLVTAGLMGRPMLSETNFFRDAVYYLVYATTPGPTTRTEGQTPGYDLFPFAEDDQFVRNSIANTEHYGDFATAMALNWPTDPVGGHARHWLNVVRPPSSKHTKAVDTGNADVPFDALPLDYYAPGPGHFYARNNWGASATVVNLQLKQRRHADHQHSDLGAFQIWRNGRFASRKSAGYGDELLGYNGTGKAGDSSALAHNGVLFGGLGQANAFQVAPEKVLRMESRGEYTYAAVDMSGAYRCTTQSSHPERDDNPYAKTAIREFVFVRGLEVLVVFDRMESSSDSMTVKGWTAAKLKAEDVPKTFVVHFEKAPQKINANTLQLTNGPEAMRVTTLVPAAPVVRVITEGSIVSGYTGQWRAEIETSGTAQNHFLHVLHMRGAADPDLTATVKDEGTTYTVSLQHPTRGNATVVFVKGMTSTGGAFGVSGSGTPTTSPLTTGVQGITVTYNGPHWN